jgi:hypothetical protein
VLHNAETQMDLRAFYCKGHGKMCSGGINEDHEIAKFEIKSPEYKLSVGSTGSNDCFQMPMSENPYTIFGGG